VHPLILFTFTGHWTTDIALPHLPTRDKTGHRVDVNIKDELNDDPDPLPEQIAAINYVLQNQEAILHTMLGRLFEDYEGIRADYGYDDELLPPIDKPEDLLQSIEFGALYVLLAHRDGVAYVGFEGYCSWDEEHGIGIMMHKDRLVHWGGADEAFSSWRARQDNGAAAAHSQRTRQESAPRRYAPHPKYGTLKPSQEEANLGYEYHLIERGYSDEFIALIESGAMSVDHLTGYLSMTFLERACQCNNEKVVRYILSKKPASLRNCIQNLVAHYNKDLIGVFLQAGVDINEENDVGQTALARMLYSLNSHYWHAGTEETLAKTKDMIAWLLAHGADPHKKDRHGKDSFAAFAHHNKEITAALQEYFKSAVIRNYKEQ